MVSDRYLIPQGLEGAGIAIHVSLRTTGSTPVGQAFPGSSKIDSLRLAGRDKGG